MSNIPVAYLIFNRPRHTRESFETIRAQRPSKLFIIADGPRDDRPLDVELCKETRKIVENIDWPCEVHRNYASRNLGCKLRVSSGLNWVFEQVDTAIVLEDDCLPNSDFFNFCENALARYADELKVWVVTGNNFQQGRKRGDASYYFSKYNHCWGWATWKRAWKHYSLDMPFWPEWKQRADWLKLMPDPIERKTWADIFDRVKRGEIDTWDYQWTACVWYHGGLTVTPNVNLVSNIGFGPDATHTVIDSEQARLPTHALGRLSHPKVIKQDLKADRFVFDHNFGGLNHPDRFFNKLKTIRDRLIRSPRWLLKKLNLNRSR